MKKLLVAILAMILLAAATVLAAAAWARQRLAEPYRGYAGEAIEIEVVPGSGGGEILEKLEAEGVVERAWLARAYLVYVLDDPSLKAGEYIFDRAMTTPEVLGKLARGEVATHRVTIIEGRTLEETAQVLSEAGFGDLETYLRLMRDPEPILDLDPTATDLEGYLFPDTYAFARGTDEEEVVDTLIRTFRTRLAATTGVEDLDVRALVTLASIVEKEVLEDEERPRVAGVFKNRLRIGMPLGADPTIIFALKLEGRWDGNIRKADLDIDSPYNTYRRRGLPPGPICSPGSASLAAAAAPDETRDLYFVSRNDGTHVFARTLAEHNRNVEHWQRRYWRERWSRDRAGRE